MITDITMNPISCSPFINLQEMKYRENGVQKSWHIAQAHDSVAILVYNTDQQKYVIVRQFRPPVMLNRDDNDGYTYELCAGIKDKIKPLSMIAAEEVYEELGYLIEPDDLKVLTTVHSAVGTSGAKQTIYSVTVKDSQKLHEGGGIDTENIDVLYMTRDQIFDLFKSGKPTTCSLQLAMLY